MHAPVDAGLDLCVCSSCPPACLAAPAEMGGCGLEHLQSDLDGYLAEVGVSEGSPGLFTCFQAGSSSAAAPSPPAVGQGAGVDVTFWRSGPT